MRIVRFLVENFKSFDKCEVNFDRFTILLGANASGKSNLLSAFRLLRDIARYGLDNAISIQGGVECVVNNQIGSTRPLMVEFCARPSNAQIVMMSGWGRKRAAIRPLEMVYRFALQVDRNLKRYSVVENNIHFRGNWLEPARRGRGWAREPGQDFGPGEINISTSKGRPKVVVTLPETYPVRENQIVDLWFAKDALESARLGSKRLTIEVPQLYMAGFDPKGLLENISLYDFDPKLSKRAQPMTGQMRLAEDGGNLAVVVKNLLRSSTRTRVLYNQLKDFLPFFDKFATQGLADAVLLRLRESFKGSKFMPAFLVSDGTINLTALIVALLFEDASLTIIEEPERNLHPHLISQLVELMRQTSQQKPIITTTHNPEVVKHARADEILLVHRDENGFSRVSRPANTATLSAFLENDLGLDQLFIQNVLETITS